MYIVVVICMQIVVVDAAIAVEVEDELEHCALVLGKSVEVAPVEETEESEEEEANSMVTDGDSA